jgi:hypothetical protein
VVVRAEANGTTPFESKPRPVGPAYAFLPSAAENPQQAKAAKRLSIVLPEAALSPLSVAVHAKQFDVALLLVKHGADPTVPDGCGESPYDLSLMQHSLAISRTKRIATAPASMSAIREIASEAGLDKKAVEAVLGSDEKLSKPAERWSKLREAIHTNDKCECCVWGVVVSVGCVRRFCFVGFGV